MAIDAKLHHHRCPAVLAAQASSSESTTHAVELIGSPDVAGTPSWLRRALLGTASAFQRNRSH